MKIIKQAHLRDVLNALEKEEITFSRATEILNEIAREAVHQALDEAAEKIHIPINPKTIDDFQPDMTAEIMKCLYDEYFAAVDLRGSILKLKEKY